MRYKILSILITCIFLSFLVQAQWSSEYEDKLLIYYSYDTFVGNDFDNEWNNGVWNGTAVNGASQTSNGFNNGALLLDGVNDYCTINDDNDIYGGFSTLSLRSNWTICAWVNVSYGDYGAILGGGGNNFNLGANTSKCSGAGNSDNFCLQTYYGGYRVLRSTTKLSSSWDKWVFICATKYNNDGLLYINGTVESSDVAGFNPGSDNQVLIGVDGDNNYLNSTIDDLFFWNETLNSSQILQLYNSGVGSRPSSNLIVTLNSPGDNYVLSASTETFSATLDPGTLNLTNATIYIWSSNGTIFNTTTNQVTGLFANTTTWNISNFELGNYNWNVWGCSSNATEIDCTYSENNYSFSSGYSINYETYTSPVAELSNTSFYLNVNLSSDVISAIANLIYSNISYSSSSIISSPTYLFTSQIITPSVANDTIYPFYWELYLTTDESTTQFNLTTNNQTVLKSIFTPCNSTFTTLFVNYTIYDESTLGIIDNTSMGSTFFWSLEATESTYKNTTVNLINSSFPFCGIPNSTFYMKTNTKLSKEGYTTRLYNLFNQRYSNTTTHKSLYLLNSSDSTNVIIEVKTPGLTPLEDYGIRIYRYVESLNSYILIHEDITDLFGQTVAKLVENDVKYKFEFYDEDRDLVKATGDLSIACRSSICVLPFVIESAAIDLGRYDDIDDYESSLTFNNNTNTFIFIWTDSTGDNPTHRLLVERKALNGTTIVCNSTSTSLTGSLSCNVGSGSHYYTAQGFREASPEIRKLILDVFTGTDYRTFGLEGLFISFILLFTLIIIGVYSPIVGVIIYLTGFIIIGLTQIVYIDWTIIVAQTVIGIIFIWAFRE